VNNDGYMPYYTNDPHGRTLSVAMTRSLQRAGIGVADLGCVVADGSAVPREDAAEVPALKNMLGGQADQVPVTSVKAAYGHLFGAAGPADAAVAIRMLKHGRIPPVANLRRPAPGFDLDFVIGTPRTADSLRHVLVTSRGLGGVNACLVLSVGPEKGDSRLSRKEKKAAAASHNGSQIVSTEGEQGNGHT